MNNSVITRRDFLEKCVILGAGALCPVWLTPMAYAKQDFVVGVNYPWIGYGHDFGSNGWGHDGLRTGGWTYQTWPDSQGFTNVYRSTSQHHNGRASLRIIADLRGQHRNKAQGEVYCNLTVHPPQGTAVPLNLKNVRVECWVKFPSGSAGNPNAPNGLQLFLRSKDSKSKEWWSFYSVWQNINPNWENRWVKISTNPSGPAGYRDAKFDPTKVIAVGLKVAINGNSEATLKDSIYLDDFVFRKNPSTTYDFERLEVDRDLATLQQTLGGCQKPVVRVFVFTDGSAAPDFTANNEVKGLDKAFFEDFNILLQVAKQRGFLLMPVLLDFHWCDKPKSVNGVQLGGRADIIRKASKRKTFFDRALKPFLEHYGKNASIYAIDIINEPEWVMPGITTDYQGGDAVSIEAMRNFVRQCNDIIHKNSNHKVTVGSARRKWLTHWQGLGLDLYQFHWYEHFKDEEPFPWQPYTDLGLDKPCIIGEVPTEGKISTTQYLEAAQQRGYHGLLVWSYRAGDKFSDFSGARPELKQWCDIY